MQPTEQLINELFWEDVERARCMRPGDKVQAGLHLFDAVRRRMMDGIRWQYPDADDGRVREILRERLAIARRLEQPYDVG